MICRQCKEDKNENCFRKNRRVCRDCGNLSSKKWRLDNKEYVREKNKINHAEYYKNNREYVIKKSSEYYHGNKDTISIKMKKYREKNSEKISERTRKIYWENPEKKRQQKKDYYLNNIVARLKRNLYNRFRRVMKGKGSDVNKYLGCSFEFLKEYLESKFINGMSWDNYDYHEWHIDHIIPCSYFDLTKEDEIKKCFHYTNMQPLYWMDNLKKGKKQPTKNKE
jgi:hypothetical protein